MTQNNRRKIGILAGVLLLYIFPLFCQDMPDQFYFSSDGTRLIRGRSESTGFYNTTTIDTIFLTFTQPNFWNILLSNHATGADLLCSMKYKGVTYDSVGVRFKGQTSYNAVNGQKKSFNITLDYKKNQDIQGYETFNLNNSFEDPSRMREFLYEYYNRKHIPAVKANYVILYLNGESWGIYVNVQQLDRQHAREWFIDDEATRWRAKPATKQPGGGPGGDFGLGFGAGKSSINYLNTMDTTVYKQYYDLKKAYKPNPWTDLVKACYKLNTTPSSVLIDTLGKYMDIDGTLWFLAQEILFTDDDSYVNKGGTDYYVYFDVGTNRLVPIEYDGNTAFVIKNATLWSPFYKETNTNYPLANILFNVPELRQRYLAHVRTIIDESFNLTRFDSIINWYAKLIDGYINTDPKKIYTYAAFLTEVANVKSFINTRRNYILSNAEVKTTGLMIGKVVFKAGNDDYSVPDSTQQVDVTAIVTGSTGISKVYLYYGTGLMGNFTKVQMFDDGLHKDGSSGDGKFGATIPAFRKGTYVRFYIESVAANAAGTRTYSPAGAEFDVYAYQVKINKTVQTDVVINELMPLNSTVIKDQSGEYDDWIELYNNSSSTVDLTGYYLSDNPNILTKWKFPSGTSIKGNDYLIIWADKDTTQPGLHANFKLSADGETVLLVTPYLLVAQEVTFRSQSKELTYSRIPNGTGSFSWEVPSYRAQNIHIQNTTGIESKTENNNLTIFPNPASSVLSVITAVPVENQTISIYSIYGTLIYKDKFTESTTIDVSKWTPGVYIVNINNYNIKRLMVVH